MLSIESITGISLLRLLRGAIFTRGFLEAAPPLPWNIANASNIYNLRLSNDERCFSLEPRINERKEQFFRVERNRVTRCYSINDGRCWITEQKQSERRDRDGAKKIGEKNGKTDRKGEDGVMRVSSPKWMSTSYISSGVQPVGRVASVSPYTRGLRSRFRFRGSTLPALLTLIKEQEESWECGKKTKTGTNGD